MGAYANDRMADLLVQLLETEAQLGFKARLETPNLCIWEAYTKAERLGRISRTQ